MLGALPNVADLYGALRSHPRATNQRPSRDRCIWDDEADDHMVVLDAKAALEVAERLQDAVLLAIARTTVQLNGSLVVWGT